MPHLRGQVIQRMSLGAGLGHLQNWSLFSSILLRLVRNEQEWALSSCSWTYAFYQYLQALTKGLKAVEARKKGAERQQKIPYPSAEAQLHQRV